MLRSQVIQFATVIFMSTSINPAFAQDAPPLVPNEDGVLFQIGKNDKFRIEFKAGGWVDVEEFECTVGIDCDAALFPTRLSAKDAAEYYDSSTVQRVKINFNLAEDQEDLVFSVARFGIETSVVRIDKGPPIVVQSEMMDPPSAEDVWGRFDLPLGPTSAGLHQIELSVLNDERGTGRHSLDAIFLTAGARE
jgi:hypothetical protein